MVPSQAVTIVICIWTLLIFVGVFGGLVMLAMSMRRRPSIEAEFATKAEVDAEISKLRSELTSSVGRVEENTREIFDQIHKLSVSVNNVLREHERDLGKLEGPRK